MGLADQFFRLLKPTPKKKSVNALYSSVYPESVRYALQYGGAQMGKHEIQSLVEQFPHEAVYLVTKAFAHDREQQRDLLAQFVRLYMKPNWSYAELKQILYNRIDTLADDVQIDGAKLAQLNRSGSDRWQQAFRDLAERCYDEDPDAMLCLIAHTPVFALHHFIDVYRDNPDATLIFLVPRWMQTPDDPEMGYEIVLGRNPGVYLQEKDECLFGTWACQKTECPLSQHYCRNCFFVDDTINTASTAGKIRSFWQTEYGLNMPENRVRVITDLRKSDSVFPNTKNQ